MAKKPSTPIQRQQKIAEKRIICFEKFLDAAFDCSRDFIRQRLAFSTLGISFLLALKELNGDIEGWLQVLWLLGNVFFVVTIFMTLRANQQAGKYNSKAALYYYNYDDPKEKKAKDEKDEIDELRERLEKIDSYANFCFLFGIGCAIIFTWLS